MGSNGSTPGNSARSGRGARLLAALLAAGAASCAATPSAGEASATETPDREIPENGTRTTITAPEAEQTASPEDEVKDDEEAEPAPIRISPAYGGPPVRVLPPTVTPSEPVEPEGSEEPTSQVPELDPTPPAYRQPVAVPLYGMPPM